MLASLIGPRSSGVPSRTSSTCWTSTCLVPSGPPSPSCRLSGPAKVSSSAQLFFCCRRVKFALTSPFSFSLPLLCLLLLLLLLLLSPSAMCCRPDALHLQHLLLLHLPQHGFLQRLQARHGSLCRLPEGGDGQLWSQGTSSPHSTSSSSSTPAKCDLPPSTAPPMQVSIIQPGNFGRATNIIPAKTPSDIWDKLDEEKKKVFNQRYIRLAHNYFASTCRSGFQSSEPVVDAMMHALVSARPRHRYLLVSPAERFFFSLLPLLPSSLSDSIFTLSSMYACRRELLYNT